MNKIGLGVIALLIAAAITFYFVVNKAPGSAADQMLIAAAHDNKLEEAKKALADGANANAAQDKSQWDKWFGGKTYDEGNTPLMYAAMYGNTELMGILLEKGAEIDAQNDDGATALMMAANQLSEPGVKFLLEKGANVLLKSKEGNSARNAANKRNATPQSRALVALIDQAIEKAGGKKEGS